MLFRSHTTAAGLLCDKVDFSVFDEEARAKLAPLRAKIHPSRQDPYATDYPRAWGSSVSVTLETGEVLTHTRTHAKGDPEAALSADEMIEKAHMLLTHAGIAQPTPFIDTVLGLPSGGDLPDLPVRF